MLDEHLEDIDWQKYKLTNDDCTSITLTAPVELNDDEYLYSLEPGLYYAAGPKSSPSGSSGFVTVNKRASTKIVYFQPYNQDKIFINRHYQNWSGWKELTNNQSDTGWIPYSTINGVEKNVMYMNSSNKGFECAYRIIKQGDVITRKLRVNARNLTNGVVFA